MKSKVWNYLSYFSSGYVMHIIATEKMTLLNGICLSSFVIMIASELYFSYRERKVEKA